MLTKSNPKVVRREGGKGREGWYVHDASVVGKETHFNV